MPALDRNNVEQAHVGVRHLLESYQDEQWPLLKSLPYASAIYDSSNHLVDSNIAFNRTFLSADWASDRRSFLERFEPFSPYSASELSSSHWVKQDVYCPSTGRSYTLHCTPVSPINTHSQKKVGHEKRDYPKNTEYVLLTVLDLTERLESLQQNNAMHEQLLLTSRSISVGEMATTLAHELNQPLGSIINYLSAARQQVERLDQPPKRLSEAIELASAQAHQAAAVLAHIREFIETRKPHREPCNIRDLIAHVATLLQLETQKHCIRVHLEVASDMPPVEIDRIMIQQVVANLVKNAIESMQHTSPEKRDLVITAKQDKEKRIQIRIKDNGCGIKTEQASQLFTPFFTTKPDGMGAGLAICRSIMEYHNGNLYFEQHPEGGTSFIVTLYPAPSTNSSDKD